VCNKIIAQAFAGRNKNEKHNRKLNQKEIETHRKVCYIRKTDRNGQL
jgi:hypothetical protein